MRWIPAIGLLAGIALAAGCGSDNTPSGYGDVTRSNFLASCVAAGSDVASCAPIYAAISGPGGLSFDQFSQIEEQFGDDPTRVPPDLEAFLADPSAADAPTSLPFDTSANEHGTNER